MDDLTTLTTTKACTIRLLRKLQENIELAQIKIKPGKSRSISIIKGKLSDQRFYASLPGHVSLVTATVCVGVSVCVCVSVCICVSVCMSVYVSVHVCEGGRVGFF